MKDKKIAYILWLCLGLVGGHHFYLGNIGKGVIYAFTAGLFCIGWFIDLFSISKLVDRANAPYLIAELKDAYEAAKKAKDKQRALEAGRAYYSAVRGGSLTIYDEQAINNDIQAMS